MPKEDINKEKKEKEQVKVRIEELIEKIEKNDKPPVTQISTKGERLTAAFNSEIENEDGRDD